MAVVAAFLIWAATLETGPTLDSPPPPVQAPEAHWGLGIDTSAPLLPGPFKESGEDRQHLLDFATGWRAAMSVGCPDEPVETVLADSLQSVLGALGSCSEATRAAEEQTLAEVRSNLTLFQGLAESVGDDLRRTLLKVQGLPNPGTDVDAVFQSALISRRETQEKFYATALRQFQAYLDHQGEPYNEGNLNNSVRSLVGTAQDLHVLEYAIDHYPWQSGTCSLPDLASESARIWSLYNETYELGDARAPARYATFIQNPHGYNVRVLRPSLENYTEDGLVLGLVGLRDNLAFYRAYWENYTADPLPTRDEARYLLRLQQSQFRSYATEGLWENEFAVVDGERNEWDRDMAVRALAIGALTWTFEDLHCTGPLP